MDVCEKVVVVSDAFYLLQVPSAKLKANQSAVMKTVLIIIRAPFSRHLDMVLMSK